MPNQKNKIIDWKKIDELGTRWQKKKTTSPKKQSDNLRKAFKKYELREIEVGDREHWKKGIKGTFG